MSHKTKTELQAAAVKIWSKIDRPNEMAAKDRLNIPQQEMPVQEAEIRAKNMEEVALGYSPVQARVESVRCFQCKNAPCVKNCPVNIDIPAFMKATANGDFKTAADIIKRNSLLPAVCGRVCPQENQCQKNCMVGKALKDPARSVEIGRIERFVSDWERENGEVDLPPIKMATGKKVAVIGSGPASVTVAADVRREGHEVVLFEAFHRAGGVLLYGIPEFRLPKNIVEQEISALEKMGVKVELGFVVGRTRTLQQLLEEDGFDAAFIGTGAGLPRFMGIPGENLVGVFSANEYLTRSNLMKAYDKMRADTPMYDSKKVAILGGGNVAMDAARTALRLGAEEVHLVYRRSEKEMPARLEEVEHAKEEGVIFHFLENAIEIFGDEDSVVVGMQCLKYKLGEPDESGRSRPLPIEGSEFTLEVDTVIEAVGSGSNPLLRQTSPGLEFTKRGTVAVNDEGRTSIPNVFAGGDIASGAATVIVAMGAGRVSARAINQLLAD